MVANKVNKKFRNVIIRGSISFVYIRILKGECKMSNVTIQKRGKYYQYKFELQRLMVKESLQTNQDLKQKQKQKERG